MERSIYHFIEGPDEIHLDPLPVYRQLWTEEFRADAMLLETAEKDSKNPEPVAKLQADGEAAQLRIRAATLRAFNLKPYTWQDGCESGWLELEVDVLLLHFTNFMATLKKNMATLLTSQQPTQGSSEPTTTEPSLACGSTLSDK